MARTSHGERPDRHPAREVVSQMTRSNRCAHSVGFESVAGCRRVGQQVRCTAPCEPGSKAPIAVVGVCRRVVCDRSSFGRVTKLHGRHLGRRSVASGSCAGKGVPHNRRMWHRAVRLRSKRRSDGDGSVIRSTSRGAWVKLGWIHPWLTPHITRGGSALKGAASRFDSTRLAPIGSMREAACSPRAVCDRWEGVPLCPSRLIGIPVAPPQMKRGVAGLGTVACRVSGGSELTRRR